MDSQVHDAMAACWLESVGNPHSSEHSFGWRAAKALEEASMQIATLIGADADEIFFTSGATESNNLALKGFSEGKRSKIVSTQIEHKCIVQTLRHMQEQGSADVVWIDVDSEGYIDPDSLRAAVDENTRTISVIGVQNEIGTIQRIDAIAEVARSVGATLHLDMAQAVNAMALNDIAEKADTISLSSHKFYGPMGIGCLYIRRSIQSKFEPQMHGGGQQFGMRSGTVPVPLCVGMGKAAQLYHNHEDAAAERARMRELNDYLWHSLKSLDFDLVLNGPPIHLRHPGNLNVSFLGFAADEVIGAVQPHLAISSGSACTSGIIEPSHVIQALGASPEVLSSAIRFSIGKKTTKADIEEATSIVNSALLRMI